MDVKARIAAGLPHKIKDVEAKGRLRVHELWLLARAYSRLRHRTHARKRPAEHDRLAGLKTFCVRLAVARDPTGFLVFRDPGWTDFWLIYNQRDRTLLHLPLASDPRVSPEVLPLDDLVAPMPSADIVCAIPALAC
jgi:hypothetical protein